MVELEVAIGGDDEVIAGRDLLDERACERVDRPRPEAGVPLRTKGGILLAVVSSLEAVGVESFRSIENRLVLMAFANTNAEMPSGRDDVPANVDFFANGPKE